MTTNTVLARNYQLSRDYHTEGWSAFINDGGYSDEDAETLVGALSAASSTVIDRFEEIEDETLEQ